MRIGIFDSGRGGEFVADELRELLPEYEYIVVNDRKNVPYGSRSNDEIIGLTTNAIQPLLLKQCPIVVIACNTATTAAIANLRLRYPATVFIGIEPMIKPAATSSHTRHITVLATPLTLRSARYLNLKTEFAAGLIVDEPDTSGWATLIEYGRKSEIDLSDVKRSVSSGSDTIVLACTHYHALADRLRAIAPNATILQPTKAIAQQVVRAVEGLV